MSGPTILVADDDASVRLVISQTLAQEGYHVRATNTMSALWRWIQAGEGDLLITDDSGPLVLAGDSLDISWLKDEGAEDAADLPEPAVLAREAVEELNGALAELEAILAELGEPVTEDQ